MNAQGVKNEQHLKKLLEDPDYVAQEKLDGVRAIVHITKGGLRIFSRSAGVDDPTRPLEKTSALPHLAELKFPELVGTVLDCEILIPGQDSATIAGTVHRKETNGQNTQVKMFVFDVLYYCVKDITNQKLEYRLDIFRMLFPKLVSEHIVFLPYTLRTAEKKALYLGVLANRGEGIMLKNLSSTYVQGGRPAGNWYKAKKSATFDCVVMGFTKGAGKYNNRIGAVKFGQYVKGKLVELGQASGMPDSVRYDMSDNPLKYIGKVVTINGMERLRSGAIRHPQFAGIRSDKKPNQCIWYENEQ